MQSDFSTCSNDLGFQPSELDWKVDCIRPSRGWVESMMTNVREIHDAGSSEVKKLGHELKNWDPNSFQAHNVPLASRTQILSQTPGTPSDIQASWRIEG